MAPKKRSCYVTAAARYKPRQVQLLFIAESPPRALERYFYYENSKRGDWLWIALMKGLFGGEFKDTKSERPQKPYWLAKFRDSGCFLMDAVKQPIFLQNRKRVTLIKSRISEILAEVQALAPQRIVLVKNSVHSALFPLLKHAGWNVVNEKALPFPASWHQRRFQHLFAELSIPAWMRSDRIERVERHLREGRIVAAEPLLRGTGYWGRAEAEFANALSAETDLSRLESMNRRYEELALQLRDRTLEKREQILLSELNNWRNTARVRR
jgi:hypothetical protein